MLQLALLDQKRVLSIAERVITRDALRRLAVVLTDAGVLTKVDTKLVIIGIEVLIDLRPIALSYTVKIQSCKSAVRRVINPRPVKRSLDRHDNEEGVKMDGHHWRLDQCF